MIHNYNPDTDWNKERWLRDKLMGHVPLHRCPDHIRDTMDVQLTCPDCGEEFRIDTDETEAEEEHEWNELMCDYCTKQHEDMGKADDLHDRMKEDFRDAFNED